MALTPTPGPIPHFGASVQKFTASRTGFWYNTRP